MAIFPCAVGSHRYPGRQQSAYLGIVNGSVATREKLRLCPAHFGQLREFLDAMTELSAIGEIAQIDDANTDLKCCEKWDVDKAFTCYANIYPTGEESRAYWALMCADHVTLFAERAQITL